MAITTLGHSTHEPDQFIRICKAARVEVIVDVRSHRSSHWPWWHGEQMDRWLPAAGIGCEWAEGLGGWTERNVTDTMLPWGAARGVDLAAYTRGHFPKQRIGIPKAADQPELWGDPDWVSGWTNQGLHDYSWYTATDGFRAALADLVAKYGQPTQPRCAIICSELLWWKCHRSMVADVLAAAHQVAATHLTPVPANKREQAAGEPGKIRFGLHQAADRLGRYPTEVRKSWEAA
ncbi:MAG TPA: DUF488 domain-containing protein [Nocardioidaceae bacterium]|nr:DUF488 domain-containing protein [Nocardioidaceae bacterium]